MLKKPETEEEKISHGAEEAIAQVNEPMYYYTSMNYNIL